jgi:hypothetical protein
MLYHIALLAHKGALCAVWEVWDGQSASPAGNGDG